MSQEPGQVIAQKYELVRRLARGGMGAVWCARHLELETEVALKFVRSEEGIDPSKEERFRREARAAAQIKSQHVVQIHDYGIDRGAPYIAMELLSGEDLESYLQRRGSVSLSEAVELIAQASKGLRAAHQCGVIHRDIKPSNLFMADLAGERLVKVLDFGIAKGPRQVGGDTTTQGQVFGSPAYMSPEQARGGVIDVRSDVWSLGAVLYRMLTGKTPFEGANASDVVVRLCTVDATPPSRICEHLSSDVDAFFRRALARDVGRRFQNIEEFTEECALLIDHREGFTRLRSGNGAPGRLEETAPLERRPEEARVNRISDAHSPVTLRPSISPERAVYSGKRGVWTVASVLMALGALGIWLARPAVKTKAPLSTSAVSAQGDSAVDSSSTPPTLRPNSQLRTAGATMVAPQEAASQHADPADSHPGGAEERQKPSVPPQPQGKEIPSAGAKASSPTTSPPSQSPVEKGGTDPVFGLPIDLP